MVSSDPLGQARLLAQPNDYLAQYLLPPPTSDFVGRSIALGQLTAEVASGGIAVINGGAGIGKTQLARKAGYELRDRFSPQIALDLQGSRDAPLDADEALRAVIRALEGEVQLPDSHAGLVLMYRAALVKRPALILADDARNPDQVAALVPPAGSALLITSRLRFETPAMFTLDLEKLPEADAAALLRKANPALQDPALVQEVAQLCGDLPLTLRIVARAIPKSGHKLAHHVARLRSERERLARMGLAPDAVNIDASVRLSYQALSDAAQHALAQLGVFSAPFDQPAALALLNLPTGADVVEVLRLLRRHNLLEYDQKKQRYAIHEAIQSFALARLRERDAADERLARVRHARHYIRLAAAAQQQFRDGDITAGLALFDRERAQLDAARAWLQQHAGDPTIDDLLIVEANASVYIGELRYQKRAVDQAGQSTGRIPQLSAALDAALRRDNRAAQSTFFGNLGNAYFALGDARTAIECYEEILTIQREYGDRHGEGITLGNLGLAYAQLGDMPKASDCYRQRIELARLIGDRQGEAETNWNYGLAHARAGQPAESLALLETSLAFYQESGLPQAATMSATIDHVRQHGSLPTPPTRDQLRATLPHAIRAALDSGDATALQAALAALPSQQSVAIIALLEQADIIGTPGVQDMARALREFEPLLQHIAAIARDNGPRAAVAQALAAAQASGWQLAAPVHRILAGERDAAALTQSIDPNTAQLIARILEILAARTSGVPNDAELVAALPETVRASMLAPDPAILTAALDALPARERARAEGILAEIQRRARAQVANLDPQDLIGALPESIRQALEQGDRPALQDALAALEPDQQRATIQTLAQLQVLDQIDAQDQSQSDLRERFATLLRDIASVALGDDRPRAAVEQALEQIEQNGWMLRAPVSRIWQGERDATTLTADLDAQDATLVEAVLALIAEYEHGARRTLAQLHAELPAPVRQAIEQQDAVAYAAALAALDEPEQARVVELLAQLRPPDTQAQSQPRDAEIEQIIQSFLPLLGDIALAAHGDATARALAEAALPSMADAGWQIAIAAQRIWAGERDAEALTAELDPRSAQLIRYVLGLIADDPNQIRVAGALQIAGLRQQADTATAQALASADMAQRTNLATQLEQLAQQAEQLLAAPWRELAIHLRTGVARLGDPSA